ncbi:HTH_Tnp_Tc3_2 domain-containing protein [Trichonephila clavipes]|nr:HTH_Tnp_Tc3_2 domain-containing protein [Trichonephila clavipes]
MIMHDRMLLVLYGPSLIRKMFDCCPSLHVHQISHQQKMSGLWLPSDWLVTIRQSLRLIRYNGLSVPSISTRGLEGKVTIVKIRLHCCNIATVKTETKVGVKNLFSAKLAKPAVILPLTKHFVAIAKIIQEKAYLSSLERDLQGKVALNEIPVLLYSSSEFSSSRLLTGPSNLQVLISVTCKFVDNRQWGLVMSERSRLPDLLRWTVVGWMEMALSQDAAARRLNVSRSVAHRLCNQYQTEAFVSRRYVPGQPRATMPAGDHFIALSARRRKRISVPQLVADHSVASERRLYASTVRRGLHNSGLYARGPVVCVPLNRQQRRACLSWAREYVSCKRQLWASVLFTDELRFTLGNERTSAHLERTKHQISSIQHRRKTQLPRWWNKGQSRKISISAERRGRADRKTNQEIKSNHWEVGGRPQCDKCSCRVRNCSQHRFTTLETISNYRNSYPGFSSDRPRGTTPADDWYIVLQARRNRWQTAGEIARHTGDWTTDIAFYRGQKTARWWSVCTTPCTVCTLTPAHWKRRSLWGQGHRNWRDNEWGRVLFTDESRFSLSSNSHRILIWRERGSRNHPSNIIERDRYGGRGVLVWGGIRLGSRTDLHIFDVGSINGTHYCNEILLPYVRLFLEALWVCSSFFMDDNAPCHRIVAAEQLLESRRLAARTLPPVTIRELRLALQDEWAAMPQQLIDTLILSMGRRCETCLAVRGDHIPY